MTASAPKPVEPKTYVVPEPPTLPPMPPQAGRAIVRAEAGIPRSFDRPPPPPGLPWRLVLGLALVLAGTGAVAWWFGRPTAQLPSAPSQPVTSDPVSATAAAATLGPPSLTTLTIAEHDGIVVIEGSTAGDPVEPMQYLVELSPGREAVVVRLPGTTTELAQPPSGEGPVEDLLLERDLDDLVITVRAAPEADLGLPAFTHHDGGFRLELGR